MTAPKITPSPSINTPLEEVKSNAPALTAKRVGVIGEVLIDLILAQVCLALGNVSILGVKPFTFLTTWGYNLQQKAADAYKNSFAVVDARAGAAAGTTTSGSIVDVYNAAAAINSTANTAATTATTAASTASTAITNNAATNTAIYNGFYSSGGTGSSSEVQTTLTDIKTQLVGGWTVQTITTSSTWTRPWSSTLPREFWAICISGGGGGGGGRIGTTNGVDLAPGYGGAGGKYVAQQIDPADVPSTVSVTIGAGGSGGAPGGYTGAAGGSTSFGALASASNSTPVSAIGSLVGYYDASTSGGGQGGDGRSAQGTSSSGTAGADTPLAFGGALAYSSAPGSYTTYDGGTASLTGQTRCGGGGGGGGNSYVSSSAFRGAGNGGYPGGGGGGAGSWSAAGNFGKVAGSGGNGANGAVVVLWR